MDDKINNELNIKLELLHTILSRNMSYPIGSHLLSSYNSFKEKIEY